MAPFSTMQTAQQNINGARLLPVEDSGHMMMLEQPASVAALLNELLA